jgi:hypothetical protein
MLFVMPRLHRTYGAHQMHDHLSEPGMEESG